MTEPRLTVELVQDTDAKNPFESFDQLGEIAHWHRDYRFGSKDEVRLPPDKDAINEWLKEQDRDLLLPLYLFDHSGLSVSTSTGKYRACDSAGWDWGQVGFIFTTRERYEQMCESPPRRYWKAHAKDLMRSEVETLDQYLTGAVYGYEIRDQVGEVLDSCWGFYGHKNAEAEANDALAYWRKKLVTPDLPGLEVAQ